MSALIADWRRPAVLAMRDPRTLTLAQPGAILEWKSLRFRAKPQLDALYEEFDDLVFYVESIGITVHKLTQSEELSLDSIYVRDSITLSPSGLVACRMAKHNRLAEPNATKDELSRFGYSVNTKIEPPGTLEGGDIVWLDDNLCAVGISYRTNLDGAEQFRRLCIPEAEVVFVHLSHSDGPNVILHLSSLMSVLAPRTVLADMRYLPVSFVQSLLQRGFKILSIPEDERHTLAANVLPVGGGTVISISGNAKTQSLLSTEGFRVHSIRGDNLSILGDGGPTCLTRPLIFDDHTADARS